MAFEQELRSYLEELEREAPAGAGVPPRHIDEHELHRHLLDRLRELEHGEWSSQGVTLSPAGRVATVKQLFDEWSGKLASLARYLEALPAQLASIDLADATGFARRVLDAAIGCFGPEALLIDRLELQRIVAGFRPSDAMIGRYGLENRLVRLARRGRSHRPILTEIGQVFLRLRGKEAVRWLVTNEVVQSTGPSDPWHAPHALLEEAAGSRGVIVTFESEHGPRYDNQTLNRLTSLRLLEDLAEDEYEFGEYRAAAAMRDVVQAVLEPGPWHTAIRALLADERAVVLPGLAISATDATIEQTKLIAHEVRNALIPVRYDLEGLQRFATEHAQQRLIDTAKQGVARVLGFVEEMVQMSEVITEPATPTEIGAVIDEVLGWIDTEKRVQRRPFPGAVHLLAPHARLVRAISNIVGNALQATTADQLIRLSIAHPKGIVRVVVDDGGPGVPIEDRERIFLEGVTMRRDGTGSGFGLAFARRVVERALHGKLWCEGSDLGGARFVIEIPETSH